MMSKNDRIEIVAQVISGFARSGPTTADYNFATEIVHSLDAYDRTAHQQEGSK
jgi:hypothetical protein